MLKTKKRRWELMTSMHRQNRAGVRTAKSTYSADWAGWHPRVWFSGDEGGECICSQNHNPEEERVG